jgi:tetratricopeptide (TPR) repeat protein
VIGSAWLIGCAAPRTPCPGTQSAPVDDLARARAEFDEALARQTAGDWIGALRLLRRVAEVRTTPQVRFNIALCEEFLGRLNAARGHYQQAAADARNAGATAVVTQAEQRASELVRRIPTVSIRGHVPGTTVAIDGVEVGDAALAHPLSLDPGEHEIVVTAPGKPPVRVPLRLAEQQRKVVELPAVAGP